MYATTCKEIWEKAKELQLDKKHGTKGNTPYDSIGAVLYTSIKEYPDSSDYVKVSNRPTRFALRNDYQDKDKIEKILSSQKYTNDTNEKELKYHERDLHPLLVKYLFSDPHFTCFTKTILHEKSIKRAKGVNEWLHPDLVGVYFPFDDYKSETRDLQKNLNISTIRLFAFEMKISLSYVNLRQCYFQAVSNSSWANEGYLVCLNIDEDPDFRNELQRLTNSFGIGIIKLDKYSANESEVLFPAKFKENIDWDTVNRLVEDSPEFSLFITNLTEDIKISKIKSSYDPVLSENDMDKYIEEKKIV